jgi:hypothetical protein
MQLNRMTFMETKALSSKQEIPESPGYCAMRFPLPLLIGQREGPVLLGCPLRNTFTIKRETFQISSKAQA